MRFVGPCREPCHRPGGRREGLATRAYRYGALRRTLRENRQGPESVHWRQRKSVTGRIRRALAGAGLALAMVALDGAVVPRPASGAASPQSAFAPAEKPLPPKVKTMGRTRAQGVLGQPVRDAKGQTIG